MSCVKGITTLWVGSIPADVIAFFIDIKSIRSHYGPGIDSVSDRNEYQGHFLGGGLKGGRYVRLTTLPPSCAVGNLGTFTSWKPLDHAGPVTGLIYIFFYTLVILLQ
jgi:hypothetical protein